MLRSMRRFYERSRLIVSGAISRVPRLIGSCIRFIGPVSAISIALFCLLGLLFFWLWGMEDWRVYVSASAAGVAALLGSAAGLIGERENGRWFLAVAGGLLIAWVTQYTNADLSDQNKALAEKLRIENANSQHLAQRLGAAKGDMAAYLKLLPQEALDRVLTDAGAKAADRFNRAQSMPRFLPRDFDTARDVLEVISTASRNNGHVLYFGGEIDRKSGYPERGHQRFYQYLEAAQGHPSDGNITAAACRNPGGFCLQRTAWIQHLLANDFFREGSQLKAAAQSGYRLKYDAALTCACSALGLYPPKGFDQLMPTLELIDQAQTALGIQAVCEQQTKLKRCP